VSRDVVIARDKGKGKMENRPAGARTGKTPVSGTSRQNDEPARRNSDTTPLPDEKAPDWAALGSTRVVPGMADAAAVEVPATEAGPDGKQPVIGDFRLLAKLGEGAMGAVYKAYQISFKREVALKVLFPHVANNEKLVKRLTREAHAMFRLDHPNIVHAYAVDEDKGWHFIAMEYIDGQSLQKWLNRLGRLSVGDALHITLACARALQHAHELGDVHRDIKPDNILISKAGEVKVADLGMVKSEDEDMALTQTGHAVGTPWYMPLEQARNAKETDGRSDIYALGCMLYCMLTGKPPFTGRTLVELIQAKEVGTFPTARSLNPDVNERLDLIIVKMTAKLARYRYQTCAEVIKDLEGLRLNSLELEFLKTPAKPKKPATNLNVNRAAATMVTEEPIAEEKPTDQWFIRHKVPGKQPLRQLTTAEIIDLLKQKKLDPSQVQASRKEEEGFRGLATYKEFQYLVADLFKNAADQRGSRNRSLYKQIEDKEKEREERDQQIVTTSQYWLSVFIKVAAPVAGVLALIAIIWLLVNAVSGK
jgi:serine/threonine protein kinase